MANSYTEVTLSAPQQNGFTTPAYIKQEHLKVYVNNILVDGNTSVFGTLTTTANLTYSYTSTTSTSINFSESLPSDTKVYIERNSSQDARLNDYSDASLLTADVMDQDANQMFFVAQEALDQASKTDFGAQTFYTSGTTNPIPAGAAGDLFYNTSTGLLSVSDGLLWESVNNKGHKQSFTTTVSQSDFTPSNPVDENTLVFLNGVLQNKGGDYTTTETTVTFSPSVASGNIVDIVSFPNSVSGFSVRAGAKVTFGTLSDDLTIHSDGVSSYITEQNPIGNLFIDSNHLIVRSGTGYPLGSDTTPQDFNRLVALGDSGANEGGLLFFAGRESSHDSSDTTNYDPDYGRWRTYLGGKAGTTAGGSINYGKMDIRDASGTGFQPTATVDAGALDSGTLRVENNCTFANGANATNVTIGNMSVVTQPTPIDVVIHGTVKINGSIDSNSNDKKLAIQGHLQPVSETRTTLLHYEFKAVGDKRIFYSGAGTATWTLMPNASPNAANNVGDGDTWVIMNVSDYNIIIDRNNIPLKHIDGTSVSSGTANRTIGVGGIAEIVYDATAACYYIFGDGIT